MKRKEFIKNTGIFIGGSLAIPSLFASNKSDYSISEYVVLINLGGGVRKQDVLGYENPKNTHALSKIDTIIPAFFGGKFPKKYQDSISQNNNYVSNQPLINQGILFSEVEAVSNEHEPNFRSLVSAKENVAQNEVHHSIFSLLSKYKKFKRNQMWQIGGIQLEKNSNFNYVPSGETDDETLQNAANVIYQHKPKFININLNDADACHSSYSSYLNSIVRSTESIHQLWNNIQKSDSEMSGKTTLIIIPEIGRNLEANSITDQHGFHSFDHNDDNSRKTWSLIVGAGISESNKNRIVADVKKAHQILPTITQLFGVHHKIKSQHMLINDFNSLLV